MKWGIQSMTSDPHCEHVSLVTTGYLASIGVSSLLLTGLMKSTQSWKSIWRNLDQRAVLQSASISMLDRTMSLITSPYQCGAKKAEMIPAVTMVQCYGRCDSKYTCVALNQATKERRDGNFRVDTRRLSWSSCGVLP